MDFERGVFLWRPLYVSMVKFDYRGENDISLIAKNNCLTRNSAVLEHMKIITNIG